MNLKKLIMWLIPLYPIMFMYMIGPVQLGLIIYTPLLLVMLAQKKKLKVDPTYRLLCLALLLDEILQLVLPYTNPTTIFHVMVPQVVFMITIICASNYLKLKDIMTPYMVISVIYIMGLFYQVYQLFVLRIPITKPILLFPNLIAETNVVSEEILRPMSFFVEPQAFATWTVIFLIIMIEKKKYWLSALATISILLSGSTEGLVLTAVIWLLYIMFFKSKFWVKLIVIIGIIVMVNQYLTMEIFSVGLNKVTETEYEENIRLVQGFRMLGQLDLTGWLFGIGTAMNHYYANFAGSMAGDSVYMTSAAGTFVTNGLIVGIMFWIFLFNKINIKHKSLFIYSVCLCILPFAQTFFFGSGFVYVIVLFYLLRDDIENSQKNNTLKNYESSTHRIGAGQSNA